MSDDSRLAVIGYCFGGTGALEVARMGADVIGVVSFHGGLSTSKPAEVGKVKAKVLVLHGAIDPHVKPAEVAAFEDEMNKAGVDWQLIAYSDTVHSFTKESSGSDNSTGAAYNEKSDKRSWKHMKIFFDEIFGERGGGEVAESTHLKAGDHIPNVEIKTIEGKPVSLSQLVSKKPSVIIFYRGGWCPYCNAHLEDVKAVENDLLKMNYQIVAISPDRPAKLKETFDKHDLTYDLYSDSSAAAAVAFRLAFKVDDQTIEKYKTYNIDLDDASGQSHHMLPVPAVFIIGTDGVIRFAHQNPDYKVRMSKDELLKAAKMAM